MLQDHRTLFRSAALAASLFLAPVAAPAQPPSPPTGAQIARMDAVLAPLDRPNAPGCGVAAMRAGAIVYERYFGLADVEHDVRISSQTKFYIASASKQFTGMAVILLALDGKLSLDDDVRKYVPELPDFGDRITIRHLLTHTSGLREETNLMFMAGWRISDLETEEDSLRLLARQQRLNFRPGDEYMYSNTGFTLLAVIVARVSGKPFPQFVADRIFKPLGMTQTEIVDDPGRIIKDRAVSYWGPDDGAFRIARVPFANVGPTGVLTTLQDLARWDGNFYTMAVGGRAARDIMDAPARLNDGTQTGYALGSYIGTYRGYRTISHAGSNPGSKAEFIHYPDQRLTTVVLCNYFNMSPTTVAHGIADVLLPTSAAAAGNGLADAAVPLPANVADFAGRYWNGDLAQATTILYEGGKLLLDGGGEGKFELRHIGGNRFLLTFAPRRYVLTFLGGPGDRRVRVEIAGEKAREFALVPPAAATPASLSLYAGTYYSPELDVDWAVAVRGDHLAVIRARYGEEPLSPLLPGVFQLSGGFFTLEFAPPANGSSPSFDVTTERVRHLRFVRTAPRGR